VTDWAAALTYYGVLAIFPALIALMSIVGLLGPSASDALTKNLDSFTPGPAKQILSTSLHDLGHQQAGAGVAFIVGLAIALWSASGYVAAFMRASNAIWDVTEGRPIWKTLPVRLAVTVFTVVVLAAASIAVVVTGPVAQRVGGLLGFSSAAVTAWDIAKWPVIVVLLSFLLAVLYYAAPNVRHPGFRWVTPGGILAILLWITASALFAVYVATFGSYNKTYGTLAGAIVFLIWLWISNIAILLGAEFNAETERQHQIDHGQAPTQEPFLPTRD
jgi:membrane protein